MPRLRPRVKYAVQDAQAGLAEMIAGKFFSVFGQPRRPGRRVVP